MTFTIRYWKELTGNKARSTDTRYLLGNRLVITYGNGMLIVTVKRSGTNIWDC